MNPGGMGVAAVEAHSEPATAFTQAFWSPADMPASANAGAPGLIALRRIRVLLAP